VQWKECESAHRCQSSLDNEHVGFFLVGGPFIFGRDRVGEEIPIAVVGFLEVKGGK